MTKEQTMNCGLVSIFGTLSVFISSTAVAQPPKHPEAEKALARIVLEKDFVSVAATGRSNIAGWLSEAAKG
jgi:hypothetical protein